MDLTIEHPQVIDGIPARYVNDSVYGRRLFDLIDDVHPAELNGRVNYPIWTGAARWSPIPPTEAELDAWVHNLGAMPYLHKDGPVINLL